MYTHAVHKELFILMSKLSWDCLFNWQSGRIESQRINIPIIQVEKRIDFCMHVCECVFLSWHKQLNNLEFLKRLDIRISFELQKV